MLRRVDIVRATRRNIPEDAILQPCPYLRSYQQLQVFGIGPLPDKRSCLNITAPLTPFWGSDLTTKPITHLGLDIKKETQIHVGQRNDFQMLTAEGPRVFHTANCPEEFRLTYFRLQNPLLHLRANYLRDLCHCVSGLGNEWRSVAACDCVIRTSDVALWSKERTNEWLIRRVAESAG
jgi:hypothetical protein